MEYCDGGPLADVARSHGGTPPWETLRPCLPLSFSVSDFSFYPTGFVHRDLKPHNILIHSGRAKVSDFGLAKNFRKAGLSGMGITGNYFGTPLFISAFQISDFRFSGFQIFRFYPVPLLHHNLTIMKKSRRHA